MNNMIALDSSDSIMQCFQQGTSATWIDSYKNLSSYPPEVSLAFRGMTQRKTVRICEEQNRNYYYIDTGYIGNLQKRKEYHRIVKNGMQHSNVVWDLPSLRFEKLKIKQPYVEFKGWKKGRSKILLVTPSGKPCKFYGIDRDKWVNDTVNEIKKYTDKEIIIRDKSLRRERVGSNNIYSQFDEDNIFALVTYQSIAAIEAIGHGIPAFTLAPTAADSLCLKDLSRIETPLYEDPEKIRAWQNWLAHCQYTPGEMINRQAINIIEKYNLC